MIIRSLFRTFITATVWIISLILLLMAVVVFFWMNVLTIPLFAVLWVLCKVFRWKLPKLQRYCTMGYPSWSEKPRFTFTDTIKRIKVRKPRRGFTVYRPWEERFFY